MGLSGCDFLPRVLELSGRTINLRQYSSSCSSSNGVIVRQTDDDTNNNDDDDEVGDSRRRNKEIVTTGKNSSSRGDMKQPDGNNKSRQRLMKKTQRNRHRHRPMRIGIDVSSWIYRAGFAFGDKLMDDARQLTTYGRATIAMEEENEQQQQQQQQDIATIVGGRQDGSGTGTKDGHPKEQRRDKNDNNTIIIEQQREDKQEMQQQDIDTANKCIEYHHACANYVIRRLKVLKQEMMMVGDDGHDVHNANLLIVFDGRSPPIKSGTVQERRNMHKYYDQIRSGTTTGANMTGTNKTTTGPTDNNTTTTTTANNDIELDIEERVKANRRAGPGKHVPAIIDMIITKLRYINNDCDNDNDDDDDTVKDTSTTSSAVVVTNNTATTAVTTTNNDNNDDDDDDDDDANLFETQPPETFINYDGSTDKKTDKNDCDDVDVDDGKQQEQSSIHQTIDDTKGRKKKRHHRRTTTLSRNSSSSSSYLASWMVAPYEADAQLAFLSKNCYIDLVITEDTDLIAHGCRSILYKCIFYDHNTTCTTSDNINTNTNTNSITATTTAGTSRNNKTHFASNDNNINNNTVNSGCCTGRLLEFHDMGGTKPIIDSVGKAYNGIDFTDFTPLMMSSLFVLLGCDYNNHKKLKGIGLITAVRIIRNAFLAASISSTDTTTHHTTNCLNKVWDEAYLSSYESSSTLTKEFKHNYQQSFVEALFMYRHPIVFDPIQRKCIIVDYNENDNNNNDELLLRKKGGCIEYQKLYNNYEHITTKIIGVLPYASSATTTNEEKGETFCCISIAEGRTHNEWKRKKVSPKTTAPIDSCINTHRNISTSSASAIATSVVHNVAAEATPSLCKFNKTIVVPAFSWRQRRRNQNQRDHQPAMTNNNKMEVSSSSFASRRRRQRKRSFTMNTNANNNVDNETITSSSFSKKQRSNRDDESDQNADVSFSEDNDNIILRNTGQTIAQPKIMNNDDYENDNDKIMIETDGYAEIPSQLDTLSLSSPILPPPKEERVPTMGQPSPFYSEIKRTPHSSVSEFSHGTITGTFNTTETDEKIAARHQGAGGIRSLLLPDHDGKGDDDDDGTDHASESDNCDDNDDNQNNIVASRHHDYGNNNDSHNDVHSENLLASTTTGSMTPSLERSNKSLSSASIIGTQSSSKATTISTMIATQNSENLLTSQSQSQSQSPSQSQSQTTTKKNRMVNNNNDENKKSPTKSLSQQSSSNSSSVGALTARSLNLLASTTPEKTSQSQSQSQSQSTTAANENNDSTIVVQTQDDK